MSVRFLATDAVLARTAANVPAVEVEIDRYRLVATHTKHRPDVVNLYVGN